MAAQPEKKILSFDDRRDIAILGDMKNAIQFCADHFVDIVKMAQAAKGSCAVALSGGSTPKAIFQLLASPPYRTKIDWKNLLLFWSDERCVPPTDPESNYHMAMEAGFASLPIPKNHIFRMPADSEDLDGAAKAYEKLILKNIPEGVFDLVMLGMGEDGHTASLFPKTHGLHSEEGLVTPNFIPQKNTWRMTLTYECINASKHIDIYVLGKNKAEMVKHVLTSAYDPDMLPIQKIGTRSHKALWILDKDAAAQLC